MTDFYFSVHPTEYKYYPREIALMILVILNLISYIISFKFMKFKGYKFAATVLIIPFLSNIFGHIRTYYNSINSIIEDDLDVIWMYAGLIVIIFYKLILIFSKTRENKLILLDGILGTLLLSSYILSYIMSWPLWFMLNSFLLVIPSTIWFFIFYKELRKLKNAELENEILDV